MQTDDKPKPQFFRVGSSMVKDGVLKAMTAVDLKVYMILALHANWTTGKCWPSYKTIHSLSGCSRTSISKAVRRLVRLGAISCRKERARNGLRNAYTVYRTLQPSSGTRSSAMDSPPHLKNRGNSGRFESKLTDNPQSSATDYLKSSGTDQNEINLNESNGKRSKEFPPPPPTGGDGPEARHPTAASEPTSPRMPISDESIKKLVDEKGPDFVINYMREHDYPVPEWLLKLAKSRQEGR